MWPWVLYQREGAWGTGLKGWEGSVEEGKPIGHTAKFGIHLLTSTVCLSDVLQTVVFVITKVWP